MSGSVSLPRPPRTRALHVSHLRAPTGRILQKNPRQYTSPRSLTWGFDLERVTRIELARAYLREPVGRADVAAVTAAEPPPA